MGLSNDCECPSGLKASSMTCIRSTDIMLGRGPTCYNNPGNRIFRKLIKEHVVFYKNQASRKEKAAVVTMLVSKLEAQGCRFLHQASLGIWAEAPSHIVKSKVGHGLRDARLTASQDGNKLPKNFRPEIASDKSTDLITLSSTVKALNERERCTRECVQKRTSKRWSLCLVQELIEEVSSATFDHQSGEHMTSFIRGDFIRRTSVLKDDITDDADALGNAFNMYGAEDLDYRFADDPVHLSSLVCEDGETLCRWFRECS